MSVNGYWSSCSELLLTHSSKDIEKDAQHHQNNRFPDVDTKLEARERNQKIKKKNVNTLEVVCSMAELHLLWRVFFPVLNVIRRKALCK